MSCQSSEVRIEGLETLDYLDNLSHKERFTEQGDAITFESEVKFFPVLERMDEKGRTQCRELPLCAGSGDFKGWIDPIKLFKSAQTSGNLSLASKLLQFPWYSHTYNYVLAFVDT